MLLNLRLVISPDVRSGDPDVKSVRGTPSKILGTVPQR